MEEPNDPKPTSLNSQSTLRDLPELLSPRVSDPTPAKSSCSKQSKGKMWTCSPLKWKGSLICALFPIGSLCLCTKEASLKKSVSVQVSTLSALWAWFHPSFEFVAFLPPLPLPSAFSGAFTQFLNLHFNPLLHASIDSNQERDLTPLTSQSPGPTIPNIKSICCSRLESRRHRGEGWGS